MLCSRRAVFAVFICGIYLPPRVFALRICLPLSSWPAINQCWMLPPRSLFEFDLFKRIDLLCACSCCPTSYDKALYILSFNHVLHFYKRNDHIFALYLLPHVIFCTFSKQLICYVQLLPVLMYCSFTKEMITSMNLLHRIIFCTVSKETIFFTIASHHFLHFFKRNNLLCSCPTSSDHKRPDDIWRHKVHHRRTHFEVQNLVQTSSNIWIEEIKAPSWQSADDDRMKYSHFWTSWFQ